MAKGIYPKKVETIRLCGAHSLILGHRPEKLKMEDVNKKLEQDPQDIGNFGLFDTSAPNYTTYYPEVTAKDLNPADEEFVEPVFRMLSNVTVNHTNNPIHFPADVLKKNMYKLIGQTVNIDHEMAVGNAIGSVKNVEWQNAYTTKEGLKIPAGINATLKIDGKSNPRIARGIMMDPPSIHANSVTVTFAFKKSHPELSDDEFWSKVGTFDAKGNLIQRIVTDIQAFHETSLVGHGADPFAQKIGKDGKIINPSYARSRYPLSADLLEEDNKMEISYYDWKQFNGTDFGIEHDININNQTNSNMDATLRLLEVIFGFEANSLTEENYQEKLKALNTELGTLKAKVAETPAPVKVLDLEGLQAIETEVTSLRAFKTEVPTDYKDKMALAEVAKTIVSELKEDTKRLYKLSIEAGKEDASILAVIDTADYKTLKALNKQYDELTDGKFGFVCKKCGSNEVTRASASAVADDGKGVTDKNADEIIDQVTSVSKVDTHLIEGKK